MKSPKQPNPYQMTAAPVAPVQQKVAEPKVRMGALLMGPAAQSAPQLSPQSFGYPGQGPAHQSGGQNFGFAGYSPAHQSGGQNFGYAGHGIAPQPGGGGYGFSKYRPKV